MLFTIAQYVAAIMTIVTALAMAIKYLVVKPIKTYIDLATYPISPHSNGGKSLPDAIASLARIEAKICDVDNRLTAVEDLVSKPTRTKKVASKSE